MTTHKSIKSKADVIDACQSRIKGIQAYAPTTGTISCSGTSYTSVQLVAIYQKCIDTRQALVGIRNQEAVAMTARDAADAARKAVEPGLIQWAVNTFGDESQQAKDLGYAPRNPTPPSAGVVAQAVTKAKATREARGTTGKKAKLAITGETATPVTAAPVTPGTTPVTPGTPKA
jgi:hypothetical protein